MGSKFFVVAGLTLLALVIWVSLSFLSALVLLWALNTLGFVNLAYSFVNILAVFSIVLIVSGIFRRGK